MRPMTTTAVPPHGGTLVSRVITGEEHPAALELAAALPSLTVDARTVADLELIATGAYSPLTGFMGLADYQHVLHEMRDRKSTRLNSSHSQISYAVFCLKKKKQTQKTSLSAHTPDETQAHVVTLRSPRYLPLPDAALSDCRCMQIHTHRRTVSLAPRAH